MGHDHRTPQDRPERARVPPGRSPQKNAAQRILALQQDAGNEAVARRIVAQRKPAAATRKAKVKAPPTPAESNAAFVRGQIARGRFIEPQQTLPPGVAGPPAPGGAFWLLNGLSPTDLYETLRTCGAADRATLLAHAHETDGLYNRPRLESALRSAAWNEQAGGVAGVGLLDAMTTAGTGSFASVFARLAGQSRPALIGVLRTLPRPMLGSLQARLAESPAAGRPVLTEVLTDLLGTGTDMSAGDVIDLQGLSGLNRRMANIYNLRGQLIQEQAAGLTIGTAAAAGIMLAESGGQTFDAGTGRSLARFENHVLWDRWGKQVANRPTFNYHFKFSSGSRWTGHFWRESGTGVWEANHRDQAQEWQVQEFAARLAGDVAYECASFGAGQIMGFNHSTVGFASAKEMAEAFNKSERSQVTGIFEFIRSNNLAAAIRGGDFLTLATRYNGTGKAAEYEAVIRSAATAYTRVTTGKRHVIP